VRNRPEDLGLNPDGDSTALRAAPNARAGVTRAEAEEGYTWQEAIRTSTFWLISFGHATSSIVIITVFVHLGLMLDDRGFSLQIISSVVAIYTAINAIFIPVGGYLGDRMSTKLVAFWFSTLQSLAVVVLVLARDTEMLMIFAVLLGVGFGGRTAVTTAMRGIYFGRKAFATIMGISMVPMNIFLFVAPVFAGYMRDATGNYDVSFLTIGAVSLIGACLFLLLGDPATTIVRTVRSPVAAD
jgi:MFS family permease